MFGVQIIPHLLAREVRDEWRVVRCPIKKKRKQWRVIKHRIDRPGAYQVGNIIYAHPDLVAQLKAAVNQSSKESEQ